MNPGLRHRLLNILQSVLLLAGMGLIVWVCLSALLGFQTSLWVLAGLFIGLVIAPGIPKRFVLSAYRARRLAAHDFPDGIDLLHKIARRAGLSRPPELHYVPSAVPNAFAVGGRADSAIAVSDGLLRLLDRREFAGVLAHEVSHIANGDLWIMALADVMSRATAMLSFAGQLVLLINLPLLLVGAVTVPWIVPILLILAPTLMSLLQLALSRAREFDADRAAAEFTGDPLGLAAALAKLERRRGRFWEDIFLPGRRIPDPSLLRTHPPTEARIRRLREFVRPTPPSAPEAPAAVIRIPAAFPVIRHPPRTRWTGLWY